MAPRLREHLGWLVTRVFREIQLHPSEEEQAKQHTKCFFNPAWQEDGTYMKIYMILYHIVYSLWIMVPQRNWFWLQNAHAFFQVKDKDPPKTGRIIRGFLGLTCCFVGLVFVAPWLYPSFWNKFLDCHVTFYFLRDFVFAISWKPELGEGNSPYANNSGKSGPSPTFVVKLGGFGSRGSEDGKLSGEETSPLRIRLYFGARNIRRKKTNSKPGCSTCLHHFFAMTPWHSIYKAREKFRT